MKLSIFAAIIMTALSLTACGTKGSLYLPSKAPKDAPPPIVADEAPSTRVKTRYEPAATTVSDVQDDSETLSASTSTHSTP